MNTFIIAGIISFIYFFAKFIEMRTVEKENKPLKVLIKDSLIVYFSTLIGLFIADQLRPMLHDSGASSVSNPAVFTDNPGF